MTDVVNPVVIKQTQDMLGKYVKKPSLSTKLLGKPPFKYLHDIITVVISETGFMKGLYTDEELSSDSIKDKESKMKFLQKAIDAAGLAIGEELPVRPNKIVAGHEAEKTNLWLQKVAAAIDNKVDSEKIVQQVLSGVKPVKGKTSSKTDQKKSASDKSKKKPSSTTKEERSSKSTSNKSDVNTKSSRSRTEENKKESKSKEKPKTREKSEKSRSSKTKSEDGKIKEKSSRDSSKTRPKSSKKSDVEKENAPPTENPPKEIDPNPISESIPSSLRIKSAKITSNINEDNKQMEETDIDLKGPEDESPNSLLQVAPESMPLEVEDSTIEGHEKVGDIMDIDPAILKAMGRDGNIGNDVEYNDGQLPSDSGVGSLDSPKVVKDETKPNNEVNNTALAQELVKSHTPAPGPAPLKAYHPDLPDAEVNQVTAEEPKTERPTTGRGIRPRTGRKSARPSSARPAPPKVRERKEVPQEEIPRPPTGKIVTNLILDNSKSNDLLDDDPEDETFTVGETKPLLDEDIPSMPSFSGTKDFDKDTQELLDGNSEAKGLLVAQIIETKKDLEDDRRESFSPETPGHRRVPIDPSLGDTNRRREKEATQREVDKLTSSIQLLTRSVNPLAKMLDYLQEDLDSMQKELETWREENKKLKQNLKAEQSMTDQTLKPLHAQLEDLESAIFYQHDQISAVKSNILRNRDRIQKLLLGINA